MAEYISKERAKHFLCEHCNEVCSDEPCEPSDCDWMLWIEKEPAADVVPVAHGRWIDGCDSFGAKPKTFRVCSVCNIAWNRDDRFVRHEYWQYCPNCGAKMDGGSE